MTVYRQIGVVGSGRVASALALALGPHSAAPPLLHARSPDRLRAAVASIGRASAASGYEELAGACDLVAIAVSDDSIEPVVADIARAMPAGRTPFVFHVSGRSGAAILDPLRMKGARTAAIHPVMTFTGDPASEVRRMAGARFAITASSEAALAEAHALVRLLGGVAVEIAEDRRPLYHAALSHAANHLVTLLSGSARVLEATGAEDPYGLLAPLVRAALENSLTRGFAALSGPLLRGDDETVRGHLSALGNYCPEVLPAYRAMALATLDELERTGSRAPSSALRKDLESHDPTP
ncbi:MULTISPECIES: DUF2520 domain-containing protein [unclassified Sphingomonas]|uniref:Rossmann-like and DUF2520 domain-containing protein n=1 Tax=unclassified Sphingomonas TaxID=196159 RepID=UPI0009280CBA|nr:MULTISPECIES: DUF2520 domain-containing protein [unclassified Sphingomonas]MBN8847908.1 DUF2520 domain-containing protein [Sphingomonas sp.]OJV34158.1 MAG: cytoplasmic protein [Sphingomonas sp. 67-36]